MPVRSCTASRSCGLIASECGPLFHDPSFGSDPHSRLVPISNLGRTATKIDPSSRLSFTNPSPRGLGARSAGHIMVQDGHLMISSHKTACRLSGIVLTSGSLLLVGFGLLWMQFVTFALTSAFSLLYLAGVIPQSLIVAKVALDFIKRHLQYLAVGGAFYGVVGVLFAPLVIIHDSELLVCVFSNVMLFVMALPYAWNYFEDLLKGKVPEGVASEFRQSVIGVILRREKTFGIIGGTAASLLLMSMAGAFRFDIGDKNLNIHRLFTW